MEKTSHEEDRKARTRDHAVLLVRAVFAAGILVGIVAGIAGYVGSAKRYPTIAGNPGRASFDGVLDRCLCR